MNIGIYRLFWESCQKYYIGSSTDFKRRKREHFWELRRGFHHCAVAQSTYYEHGYPEFQILTHCEEHELYENEKFYLEQAKGDPNCLNKYFEPLGKGHMHTDDAKRKMRESKKGEKNAMFGMSLGKAPSAKKVINTNTGQVYNSVKEIVLEGLVTASYSYLISMLNGGNKNITPYVYLESVQQQQEENLINQ